MQRAYDAAEPSVGTHQASGIFFKLPLCAMREGIAELWSDNATELSYIGQSMQEFEFLQSLCVCDEVRHTAESPTKCMQTLPVILSE